MPYFGADITRDDSWALEIAHIPQSMREEEPALQNSRWFDYRHLLPAQATYLFANRYEEIGREVFGQTRDISAAAQFKMLSYDDIFASNEILNFWRARQAADRIGCKYDFYIRMVFHRHWHRGFKFFPRPNQLYSEEIELDAKDAWKIETRGSLQLAKLDRFKNEFFVGHPDQVAYHSYLIEQVENRAHRHMILGRMVFKEKILPLEIAGRAFGADEIRRAFYLHNG